MGLISDITSKLLESYAANLSSFGEGSADNNLQLTAYRQAAAVLHCFDPDKLRPAFEVPLSENPRTLLYEDITPTPGRFSEGIFTMKIDMRRESLKQYSSRDAMLTVVENNPEHPVTSLQIMWVEYLRSGTTPDAKKLSYRELTDFGQIVLWLEDIDTAMPAKAFIDRILNEKSVLANFEHLIIDNFTGRETELSFLKRHIYPDFEKSRSKNIINMIGNWLSPSDPLPILSIYGPGGMGKSALSGRLLWENIQDDTQLQIPFAYLPFDQGTLRIESPFTILVEAASQFGLQFPEYARQIDLFNDIVRSFRDKRSSLLNRQKISNSRVMILEDYHSGNSLLYDGFISLLRAMIDDKERTKGKKTTALLVFDTFEEVEYKDSENLREFWSMLELMTHECPGLRIIITGRSPIAKLGVNSDLLTELKLEELKLADRSLLLQRLGVDKETAEGIAKQVGGNPLSLRLAASVVLSDKSEAGTDGIKDLYTKKWLFFQVDEQIIQGQLYKRILAHIHNENVRKLAHPGMVLRTVTPDVILHVLGPVCEIPVKDINEAEKLFEELKKEQALVQVGYKGDLVYRAELRQAMIRLLLQDKFNEVRELHRKAVEYYATKNDDASRAEEIYHRLALDETDFSVLDQRWMPGIENSITSNMDEYSDRIKVWLASRIDLEIPREILERASVADWERNITRKVRKATSDNQPVRALELLGERDERSDASPLFALEAKTDMLLANFDEATKVLNNGIERVSKSTNRGRLAELFWLRSQIELTIKKPMEADYSLKQAGKAVENAGNPLPYMHVLCHRLLLRNNYELASPDTSVQLRVDLNETCSRIDAKNAFDMGFVLPLALSILGKEFPGTVERLGKFALPEFPVSPDILTSENLQGLEEYRESWEEEENNFSINSLV